MMRANGVRLLVLGIVGCGDAPTKETAEPSINTTESSAADAPEKMVPKSNEVKTVRIMASTDVPEYVGAPYRSYQQATSSSALKESRLTHTAERLLDGFHHTAWCEGKEDDGIGEWAEFTVSCSSRLEFTGLGVWAGYARKKSTFGKNNRVATASIRIHQDDALLWKGTVEFADVMKEQWVPIDPLLCDTGSSLRVRVGIDSVFAGKKYKDTCMSQVLLYEKSQTRVDVVKGTDSCDVPAISKGAEVYAGPGETHPVIGRLTTSNFWPEFQIVEYQNGWFRFQNPSVDIAEPDPEATKLDKSFPKEGWILASALSNFSLSYGHEQILLRKSPKKSSSGTPVGRMDYESSYQIQSCSGKWLKVKYPGQSGWLHSDHICPNQLTNCN